MGTPRYVAVKVGDQYVMQRKDAAHAANCSVLAAGGIVLTLFGLRRRSLPGVVLTGAGIALIASGAKGCNPIESLLRGRRSRRAPDDPFGASTQHDTPPKPSQKPSDEVDEASMESFPASDPPTFSAPKTVGGPV